MEERGIEHHGSYVSVDCRNADVALWTDRSRALAMVCIQRSVDRVLVDASDCEPAGHYALRDALTAMVLGEVSSGLRLALVTNVSSLAALFGVLQRELEWMNVPARCFGQRGEAVAWLVGPPRAVL